jgi:hypothetical protein
LETTSRVICRSGAARRLGASGRGLVELDEGLSGIDQPAPDPAPDARLPALVEAMQAGGLHVQVGLACRCVDGESVELASHVNLRVSCLVAREYKVSFHFVNPDINKMRLGLMIAGVSASIRSQEGIDRHVIRLDVVHQA